MTGNRIYAGNIPWETNENELRAHFEQHGDVREIKIMTDRETGKARGFAFVEYTRPQEAQEAIKALDGTQFGGRRLVVSLARERSGGGGGVPRESHQNGHREKEYGWTK